MKKNKKTVAIAIIKDDKGRFLLIQQKSKDWGNLTDAWYPPAGHVENYETSEKCLIRELKEELNLDIQPVKRISFWKQDIKGEIGDWWECRATKGKVKFSDKTIKSFKYFFPEEMKKLKLWPASRSFFEKYFFN